MKYLLILLLFSGCGLTYTTSVSFKEDTATLESNTKANAKINMETKEAEIEQIGEPFWKKLLPQKINVEK
ncbi:MAG: hypothetical protein PHF74_08155 [Dehalococcoidales bacterium]|nr:hypothetical protein [Dehalococcoidales bacterium]